MFEELGAHAFHSECRIKGKRRRDFTRKVEGENSAGERNVQFVTTPRAIVPAAITVRVAVYAQTIPDVESEVSFMAPYLALTPTHSNRANTGRREKERKRGARKERVYVCVRERERQPYVSAP